jgi:hypothetical protein
LVLSVIAAILFAYLFNLPSRIVEVWTALAPSPPEGIPRTRVVILECVLFIALVVVVQAWLVQVLGRHRAPNAGAVLIATGIVFDWVREWRARQSDATLVPVWEIHQVYAVPPALRLLDAEGIHAFAQGLGWRSLLQFFGPYAPIRILVPASQAWSAYNLLQRRWPAVGGAGTM